MTQGMIHAVIMQSPGADEMANHKQQRKTKGAESAFRL